MKKTILSLAIGLLSLNLASAQVSEGSYSMSLGSNNGLRMELPGAEKKLVEKEWTAFSKEHFKEKAKKNKSKEYFSDDSEIKAFSTRNTVDVYADIQESGTSVMVTVFYDLGGAFLNSSEHSEDYVEAEKLMYKFALAFQKTLVEAELKEEEKELKDFNKDLEKLKKDKENYEEDIEDYKQKIEERIKDIEQNVQDQANKEAEIQTQEGVVKEVEERLRDLD